MGELTIPNNVTSIGVDAFSGCSGLEKIRIPASVQSIDICAFTGCKRLITAGPTNSGCNIEFGWATTIPSNAFYNADYLSDITLPDTITGIGDYAFAACDSLTFLGLPIDLINIGRSAFANCSALTYVLACDNIENISREAFSGCSNISDVYYFGTEDEWDLINFNQGNELLKNATIHYCLFDYTIGVNVTVSLATIMESHGIHEEIENVESDDPTLIEVKKVDNNWTVTCHDHLASSVFVSVITTDMAYLIRFGTINAYEVTFVTAHGTAPATQTVSVGGKATKPADLSWIGYKWGGWITAAGTAFNFNTAINSDTILYAKWVPDFKITSGDKGTANYGSTYAFTLNYYFPDYYSNKSKNINLSVYISPKDSTYMTVLSDDYYVVTQASDKRTVVTLKASYIRTLEDGATYDILFDTGLPDPPVDIGATVGTFNVSKAVKTNCTVTFDKGAVTEAKNMPDAQQIEIGRTATKPTTDPTATGYRFDKWCKDSACTKEFDFSKEVISTDTTIYAKWVKTHTIDFTSAHGITPTELVIDENGKAKKPTDPTMEAYIFGGWYTDKEFKNAFNWDAAITEDVNLYAKWTGNLKITKGDAGTAHYGSTYEFTLNCSLAQVYNTFTVKVNGKLLDPELYELSEGSTVVTLKKAYIRSLAAGSYTIDFDTGIEDLGKVRGSFMVSTSPKTGDESDIGLWIAVGCLSAVAAAAIVVYLIRKKK